jgi:hypothetical protein
VTGHDVPVAHDRGGPAHKQASSSESEWRHVTEKKDSDWRRATGKKEGRSGVGGARRRQGHRRSRLVLGVVGEGWR